MAHRAPIVIVPYSTDWPALFESERAELAALFATTTCRIEHVGSSAVPGVAAKAIVDILLDVASLREIDARIGDIVRLGYEYMPEHEAELPERRFFAKPVIRPRTVHLHGVAQGGAFWHEHLLFRDALRRDAGLAAEYVALKHRLAAELRDDREGYTNAKGPFISAVVGRSSRNCARSEVG